MQVATAQRDGDYREPSLVKYPATDMLLVRQGNDRSIFLPARQGEIDRTSGAHMAQSRDPGLQTMPAEVLWIVEGEDQVVCAKFDLPQGGECWLGWTDCGSEEYSLQQQHEVGLRTMPIRTRFEKRGRLDCSSSDIVARDNCGVFKHVPAEGLVFERVVAEGCGWDGVNLLWMGDDCPAWITGTTAGRKRWPANAIIRYIDDWPRNG
jgi:hypothetical protein